MGGIGDWSHLVLKVVAMGPVRVLQIFDSRMANLSSPTLKATSSLDHLSREAKLAAAASATVNGIKASDSPSAIGPLPPSTSLQLQFYAASIGVSVIDHKPQELLFLSITDVDLAVCMLGGDRQGHTLDVQVGRVQLDSQLWSTPYPSLLFPLLPDRCVSPSSLYVLFSFGSYCSVSISLLDSYAIINPNHSLPSTLHHIVDVDNFFE